jgi:hypothetical protein
MLTLIGKISLDALLVAAIIATAMRRRRSERFGFSIFCFDVGVLWLLAMMVAGLLFAGWFGYVIYELRTARWGI